MGLFSFGGSSSRSRSSSSSSSFDNLDAFDFGFGFDTSTSTSRSGGRSRSGSRSSQGIAFEEIFANLFGGATSAAAGINTGNISGAANLLFSAGGGIIDSLMQGGAGAEFLNEQIKGADGIADAQVDQLGADLSRFLSEDVSGAITSGGVSASTLGGSRGEVQAGIAERGAAEAFVRGSTDIRSRSSDRTTGIAQMLMQSEAERGATSLAALPQLFGLAEAGEMARLSPFAALAQILGPMQTLTTSESFGESDQFSEALAEALGINLSGGRTTGRAGSQSESESSGRSRSANFGFG